MPDACGGAGLPVFNVLGRGLRAVRAKSPPRRADFAGLSLPEPPAPHLVRWCEENGIINHAERIAAPREGTGEQEVTFTHERIADLLQLLVMPERQPVYVHCLDGVGITGTLIMCLRKLQRWSPPPFVDEYARFARDGLEVPTPP